MTKSTTRLVFFVLGMVCAFTLWAIPWKLGKIRSRPTEPNKLSESFTGCVKTNQLSWLACAALSWAYEMDDKQRAAVIDVLDDYVDMHCKDANGGWGSCDMDQTQQLLLLIANDVPIDCFAPFVPKELDSDGERL
jgi:hypothetical protein